MSYPQVRFAVYNVNSYVEPLVAPSEFAWASPLSDTPTLSMKYALTSLSGIAARTLLDNEYDLAVQVNYGAGWVEPVGGRFTVLDDDSDAADPNGIRSFSCLGSVEHDLSGIVNLNVTSGLIDPDDNKFHYKEATVGAVLRSMIIYAQGKGLGTALTLDFTDTHDSAGVPWSYKYKDLGVDIKTTALQLLQNFVSTGLLDYRTQGNKLQVYNVDTVLKRDRTACALLLGREFSDGPQKRSRRDYISDVLAIGEKGKLSTHRKSIVGKRGRRATVVQAGGSEQDPDVELLVEGVFRQSSKIMREQYTRTLRFESEELPPQFYPYRDYVPGDTVSGPGVSAAAESLRVRQITLQGRPDGTLSGSVVLNDRFLESAVAAARRLQGITGGAVKNPSGNNPPQPISGRRKPKAPANVYANSLTTIVDSGAAMGLIDIHWDPVTTDTAGVPLRVTSYDVRGRPITSTGWRSFGSSADADHFYDSGLYAGTEWQVSVAARSETAVLGEWSVPFNIKIEPDIIPPNKPAAPTATSTLGTVTVGWSGKDTTGTKMPLDFDRFEIFRLGVTAPVGTLNARDAFSSIVLTNFTRGQKVQFRGQAVDRSGNRSVMSDYGPEITVKSVLDDPTFVNDLNDVVINDAAGNSQTWSSAAAPNPDTAASTRKIGDLWYQLASGLVTNQWRFDGATWIQVKVSENVLGDISAAKITTGTLSANRIGALAITADKIAVGAITGEKITVDALDGKVITGTTVRSSATGTRVQFDDLGIRMYSGTTLKVHMTTARGQLRTYSTGDLSHTSTGHGFQIGDDNGLNLAFDSNEIMARNNGQFSELLLNREGGKIVMGGRPGGFGSNDVDYGVFPASDNYLITMRAAVQIGNVSDADYADEWPPLMVGVPGGLHLAFDSNEIMAVNGDEPATLYIMGPRNVPNAAGNTHHAADVVLASNSLYITRGGDYNSGDRRVFIGGRDGEANIGIRLERGLVSIRDGDNNSHKPIAASAFTVASQEELKQNIADFDAESILMAAPSKRWQYQDRAEQGEHWHYGPMLEDLPNDLHRELGSLEAIGGAPVVGYDLSAMVGILWGAYQNAVARLEKLESAATKN